MKKWISYFLLATSVFSLDFSTEIDATYQTDFSSNNTPITLKLNGEHSTDNIYRQFEIKADSETEELELTKAYGDIVKGVVSLVTTSETKMKGLFSKWTKAK